MASFPIPFLQKLALYPESVAAVAMHQVMLMHGHGDARQTQPSTGRTGGGGNADGLLRDSTTAGAGA